MSTFADDTKLGGAVFEGQDTLKRDLDRLGHWAMINEMQFDNSKCWILHLGWSKTRQKYKLREEWRVIIRRQRIEGMTRKPFVLSQFREVTEQMVKLYV